MSEPRPSSPEVASSGRCFARHSLPDTLDALPQVNIEGGTGACSAFNDKHSLTLPHYGLKGKNQIGPFGVQYIPHHVAIGADGSIKESPAAGLQVRRGNT